VVVGVHESMRRRIFKRHFGPEHKLSTRNRAIHARHFYALYGAENPRAIVNAMKVRTQSVLFNETQNLLRTLAVHAEFEDIRRRAADRALLR
jgi:hypothetical protein